MMTADGESKGGSNDHDGSPPSVLNQREDSTSPLKSEEMKTTTTAMLEMEEAINNNGITTVGCDSREDTVDFPADGGDDDEDDNEQLMSLIASVSGTSDKKPTTNKNARMTTKEDPPEGNTRGGFQPVLSPKHHTQSSHHHHHHNRYYWSVLMSVSILLGTALIVRHVMVSSKGSGGGPGIVDKKSHIVNDPHDNSHTFPNEQSIILGPETTNNPGSFSSGGSSGGSTTYISAGSVVSTDTTTSSGSSEHASYASPAKPKEKESTNAAPTKPIDTTAPNTDHSSPSSANNNMHSSPNQDSGFASPHQNNADTSQHQKNNHASPHPKNNHASPPHKESHHPDPHHGSSSGGSAVSGHTTYPHFQCPPISKSPDAEYYLLADDPKIKDETVFLTHYQKSQRDREDGMTYEDYKDEMYDWKEDRFAPYLQNGDTIYESASGLGLNLVMTLEILKEAQNITHLVVYGNDYVTESVVSSNRLIDLGILEASGGSKGVICQGDSRNLSWVPSNSFDLVFTGQIPPLQNPLDLDVNDNDDDDHADLWWKYKKICHGNHPKQKDLVNKMQELQEDYFAEWVSEMIRIAKPGVPIIIEQVSQSVCKVWDDWGGVDKDFWYRAVDDYEWNVDFDSLELEDSDASQGEGRYHVFMRKTEL